MAQTSHKRDVESSDRDDKGVLLTTLLDEDRMVIAKRDVDAGLLLEGRGLIAALCH